MMSDAGYLKLLVWMTQELLRSSMGVSTSVAAADDGVVAPDATSIAILEVKRLTVPRI